MLGLIFTIIFIYLMYYIWIAFNFDKTGKQIVALKYDEIGCVIGTQEGTSSQNLLIIPEYEAIVVGNVTTNGKKHGLINSLGEELITCVLDSIYSVTSSGQDTYWMEQIKSNEVTVRRDIIEWLQQNGKQMGRCLDRLRMDK